MACRASDPPPLLKHHHPLFQVVSLRVNPASCPSRRVPFRWTIITAPGHDGDHRSKFAIKWSGPWKIVKIHNGSTTHSYQVFRVDSSNQNYTAACGGMNEWMQSADESQVQIQSESRCLGKNVTRLPSRFVINHRSKLQMWAFCKFHRIPMWIYMTPIAPDWRDRQVPERLTTDTVRHQCHAHANSHSDGAIPFKRGHDNLSKKKLVTRSRNAYVSFIVYFFLWFLHAD